MNNPITPPLPSAARLPRKLKGGLVVTRAQSPVQQRRKVGRALRSLREASGLTIEAAGKAIQRSDSTMSRIENGLREVQIIELKGLLEAYKAADEDRAALLGMVRNAPEGGLWTAHEATFPPTLETYLGLEEAAESLHAYSLGTIHSLLRTREVMHAIVHAGLPMAEEAEVDALTNAHMDRQQLLHRQPPLDLRVVLDEAALRRPVVSPEATRHQFDQLIEYATERKSITIQVLPYSRGAHGSLVGSFAILDFPDPTDPKVVYCDTPGGNLYLQKPQDTRHFDQLFGRLCADALAPGESVEFLKEMRDGK